MGGPASSRRRRRPPSAGIDGAGIGVAVARLSSAADRDLHLADAWDLHVLPRGWTARAATEPWKDATLIPAFTDPFSDTLYDPVLTDHLHLRFASHPIGDSTPDEWVAEQLAGVGCPAAEPIAVDGATGLIGADDCDAVAVATAGRGYWIALGASNDDPVATAYDRVVRGGP